MSRKGRDPAASGRHRVRTVPPLPAPIGRRGVLAGAGALVAGSLLPRGGWADAATQPVASPATTLAAEPATAETTTAAAPAAWRDDKRVYIQNRSGDQGKSYRIVGDLVQLGEQTFPSLARPDGAIIAGRTSILVEARELLIDMPLRFDDAELVVLADRVLIGRNGSISFAEPGQGYAQRLDIRTRIFSLAEAGQVPLHLHLGRASRDVRIAAASFVDGAGTATSDPAAIFAMIRAASLDRRDDALENASGHAAVVVDAESADYKKALALSAWPQASVLKLQRTLASAPYDPAVTSFVLATVAELRPTLKLQASRVPEVIADGLSGAILRQTDGFGLGAHDVPMTSLSERIDRFSTLLDGQFGDSGVAAAWDALAVEASRSGAIDLVTFKSLSGTLAGLDTEFDTIKTEAADVDARLDALETEIGQLNNDLALQENFIKQQIAAKQFHNQNDGIAKGVQVVAAVGSVCFPAAAPFLLAASAIVTAVDAVKRNNGDLLSQAATITDVVQLHVAIAEKSRQVREQWTLVVDNIGAAKKYVSASSDMSEEDKQAFAKWKSALDDMRGSAGELYKLLKATAPLGGSQVRPERDPQRPRDGAAHDGAQRQGRGPDARTRPHGRGTGADERSLRGDPQDLGRPRRGAGDRPHQRHREPAGSLACRRGAQRVASGPFAAGDAADARSRLRDRQGA